MFLHPLGLLALAAVPAVVALHLFRRRFRPHVVSAVFLWEPQDRTPVAGRKREPLRTSPSFWCELFAALLLALAFAGPRGFGAGEAEHLVVVLDASASMGASTAEGTFADAARDLVRDRIDGLRSGSRVTVVQSGTRPSVLVGPAAFKREALIGLDDYAPTLARHDLAPAVAFALKLAGGGAVTLVTDEFRPNAWPVEVTVVSVGEPLDNVAITHATRRRTRDDATGEVVERVHLSVESFARRPVRTEVALLSAGVPLDSRAIELAPSERRHLSFSLAADAPAVEARLPADNLPIDDVAYLAPVPPRTVALASTLPEDLSRFLGLATPGQSASSIDRWLDLVPDSVDAKSPGGAHLVLSETVVPGASWCFVLSSAGEERKHLIGPFLSDKRHPLLQGTTFEGIVWSISPNNQLPGSPIVSAGDEPIVTEEREGERIVIRMNLDAPRSSLHRSPDWPILLANLAEMRRAELPGPARTNLSLGETFLYRGTGDRDYRFTGEGVDRSVRGRGTLAVEDVTRPGVYTLSLEDRELCQVGYSFVDPRESDLSQLASGERDGERALASVLADTSWAELLFIALALGLIALDWAVLSGRRRTAGGEASA